MKMDSILILGLEKHFINKVIVSKEMNNMLRFKMVTAVITTFILRKKIEKERKHGQFTEEREQFLKVQLLVT